MNGALPSLPVLTLAVSLAIAAITGPAQAAERGLDAYRDRARVLVVATDRADDPALTSQRVALASAGAGMGERDLILVTVIAGAAQASDGARLSGAKVRRAAGLAAGRGFGAALIGKDGGVKLIRHTPIDPQALFATIDAMPMRRDEMRGR